MEYLVGLSALIGSVESFTWSQVAGRFLFDPDMRRRLLQNNPYAGAEVAQKLGEAIQRGYWQASDQERQQLKEAYLEIENWIESGVEG